MQTRRRKPPAQRRGEIVAAAGRLALAEGLHTLTLRRVAEELGVAPGLVNHYFPAVDDLAASAFAHAAAAEREAVFAISAPDGSPVTRLRRMLAALLCDTGDAISLLWLDAWQASRSRPALRAEVSRQMVLWQEGLAGVICTGCAAGLFHVTDASLTAMRILALIDGLSVQAAIRMSIGYAAVRDLVIGTTELELGLPPGALGLGESQGGASR